MIFDRSIVISERDKKMVEITMNYYLIYFSNLLSIKRYGESVHLTFSPVMHQIYHLRNPTDHITS